MLTIVSAILFSFSTFAQKKDTCCPCISQPKPVKKVPASPRPWRYVETSGKGLITGSFNDSVVIEDHTGVTVIPEVSGGLNQGGRYAPPVSNLKEIKGSFNRYVSVKRFPAPKDYYRHHHHDDLAWLWPLLFIGLLIWIVYLLTRQNQTTPITIQNNIPPSPPAPAGYRAPAAPAVDIKEIYKEAATTGSTVVVFPDGGFKITPPVKKEEKQSSADVKDKKTEEKEA